MRVIIAGTRHGVGLVTVGNVIVVSGFDVTYVVSGGARGIDARGEEWARARNIPMRVFPADWDRYGKGAGAKRNEQMAEYGDALIAMPCEHSRGTWDMVRRAKAHGLLVYVAQVVCAAAGNHQTEMFG